MPPHRIDVHHHILPPDYVAAQTLAGKQDEIVELARIEPPDPREHRLRIRGVENCDQRTAQNLRAPALQHRGEHIEFASFRHGDRAAGERLFLHGHRGMADGLQRIAELAG